MASKRQIRANRANARASTGPRSAAGKARAARNALSHGLAISALDDAHWAPQVDALARHIVGENLDQELLSICRNFAQAQIDLRRIREYRRRATEKAFAELDLGARSKRSGERDYEIAAHRRDAGAPGLEDRKGFISAEGALGGKASGDALEIIGRGLAAVERYESRAISRRKFAIREFEARWAELKSFPE
jgi:hypothetical protein